jgi:hypothetical protein
MLDKNNDERLSFEEFKNAESLFVKLGWKIENLEKEFNKID